jgi:hypothetical protein
VAGQAPDVGSLEEVLDPLVGEHFTVKEVDGGVDCGGTTQLSI